MASKRGGSWDRRERRPARIAARSRCLHCRHLSPGAPRLLVVGAYERGLGEAVQGLKLDGRLAVARPLGALIAERLTQHRARFDLLTAVPAEPARARSRGIDHAAAIAEEAALRLGVPFVGGALRRVRSLGPLRELGRAERRAAVAGAFAADAAEVARRRVVVVDDVLTTGATLAACALALRQAGAVTVWGACVARRHLGSP